MRTVLLTLLLAVGAAHAAEPDPRGLWLTASGNLEVRIAPCGAALCGKVARVIANQSMSRPGEAMEAGAQPAHEGMDILSDFLPSERETAPDGRSVVTEWRGRIFNRENGKTYDALMSVGKGGELKLRAYVGLPLFGRNQAWQRVPGECVVSVVLPLTAAFGAGLATVASPCVLPLLPALLGSSLGPRDPWRPLLIVLGFIASFSALALAFGASASVLGLSAGALRDVAAVLLLGFGLLLVWPAGWERLSRPLGRVADWAQRFGHGGGRLGALALGASLGALWTPCAGPALASILALVASAGDPSQAAALLVAYAAGAGGPMLALAYGGQRIAQALRAWSGRLRRGLGVLVMLMAGASLANVSSAWVAALTGPAETMQGQVVGKPAPEFGGPGPWINSAPLTLQGLRGKVVLVDFWTWDCVNCLHSVPVIERLHQRFASRGLVVVGVHTPEFAHERPLASVQAAVRRLGLHYPVVQDNGYRIWQAFGNRYWPAAWLIDQEGRIVYRHEGEGGEAELAAAIEGLLPFPDNRRP